MRKRIKHNIRIAVDIDGVTYLWDVQGNASSDEEENSDWTED